MKKITEIISEEKEENLVIGGDINVRIGKEGTIIWKDDRDEICRKSKDKTLNTEENIFLEKVEERG